jgi:hypothetical protein
MSNRLPPSIGPYNVQTEPIPRQIGISSQQVYNNITTCITYGITILDFYIT